MSDDQETVHWTDEELAAVKDAIRVQHAEFAKKKRGSQILRAFCVCGYSTGPGTAACSALSKLLRGA